MAFIIKNQIEQLKTAEQINNLFGIHIKLIYIIILFMVTIFYVYYLTTQYLQQSYRHIYIDNTKIIKHILYENKYNLTLSFNIPILILYILNKLFINSFWNFLGFDVNEEIISSSEKKQYNKLVYYPINTYSSSCQILIGIYLMIRSNTVHLNVTHCTVA